MSLGKAPCSYLSDITLPEGCTNPLDFRKACQTISLPFQTIEMRFRLSLRCQISLIIHENITMGNLFSKPRSKPARSSAAQVVTLCDQNGVPVKTQKISDSFVQKDTVIQSEPNITAPANQTELLVATPELLHARQQVIRCTWQMAGLTLNQAGVRLSTWRG